MKNRLFILSFFAAYLLAATLAAQNTFPQQPCEVLSLKGDIHYYDQMVAQGTPIAEISGIQFSTTSDVLVLTDRYQRTFYVTPRTYTSGENGTSCSDRHADCSIVMKDHLGTVVMTAVVDYPTSATSAATGKSEAPVSYYYHNETRRYEPVPSQEDVYVETSVVAPQPTAPPVVSNTRLIAPKQSKVFKVIRMAEHEE